MIFFLQRRPTRQEKRDPKDFLLDIAANAAMLGLSLYISHVVTHQIMSIIGWWKGRHITARMDKNVLNRLQKEDKLRSLVLNE